MGRRDRAGVLFLSLLVFWYHFPALYLWPAVGQTLIGMFFFQWLIWLVLFTVIFSLRRIFERPTSEHERNTALKPIAMISRLATTVVVAIAIPVLIWGVLHVTATQRGYLSAKHDVSHGHYEIRIYGMMRMPLAIYSRMLKERYDIQCPPVSGCIVSGGEVAFNNAYNSFAKPAIIQHFGKDVFAECKKDAEAEWRRSRDLLPQEPPRSSRIISGL